MRLPPSSSIVVLLALIAAAAPAGAQGHGPIVAPAKPMIAPMLGTGIGDNGATPSAARARSRESKKVTIAARQSAEKTIAALVAAMKDLPRKADPPANASTLAPVRRIP